MSTKWIKAARIIQEAIVGPVVLFRVSMGFLCRYLVLLNMKHARRQLIPLNVGAALSYRLTVCQPSRHHFQPFPSRILWLLGTTCMSVSPGVTEVRTQQSALRTLLSVQFGYYQTCLLILNLVGDCLNCFSCCSGWLWWIIYRGCLSPQ